MPEWLIVIIVVLALFVFVGLIIAILLKRDDRRTAALRTIAEGADLDFKESEDPDIIRTKFNTLPIFNLGTNFLLHNLITGQIDGFEVWIADYIYWSAKEGKYRDGSTRHLITSNKKWQTVICMSLPEHELPAFDISLKSTIASFTAYNAKEAIVFPQQSEFTKKYIVCSAHMSDRHKVQQLITDKIKSAFNDHKGLKLEVGRNQMMLTNYQLNILPNQLMNHIDRALLIAKSLG